MNQIQQEVLRQRLLRYSAPPTPAAAVHQVLRPALPDDCAALSALLARHPDCCLHDTLAAQLRELVKLEHPADALSEADYQRLVAEKLAGQPADLYGVWVYYPWRNCCVHLLDEAEFVRVRTVRNAYKISPAEQQWLAGKKVGVVGLSVGQSVAVALALERIAGEIRLADFDTLDLSNMNRIRTSVANLGLPKTALVRREIAEIDPFLRVTTYEEGITPANVDDFLQGSSGPLDLLVEECDSIAAKVLLRQRARHYRLPVLMDTSDRGMLDVERFDLEPDYPILHGLIDGSVTYELLDGLRSAEEKLPYVFAILGHDTLSGKLKASMAEIGRSITTWPQLGTDVMLGGAIAASAARRILLGEAIGSGRHYFDTDPWLLAQTAPAGAAAS